MDQHNPDNQDIAGQSLQRFTELWMANQHVLGGFVRLQVRDHHLAEDIVQEVAKDATANFDRYDAKRPFGAWLIGIARQRIAEYYRKTGRRQLLFSSELMDRIEQTYIDIQPEIDDRTAYLEACMKQLNERHRRLIQLRYEQMLAPDDIAAKVGAKTGSVNVMLHRIRKALVECVQNKMGVQS